MRMSCQRSSRRSVQQTRRWHKGSGGACLIWVRRALEVLAAAVTAAAAAETKTRMRTMMASKGR
jgi:hypothetical protein